MIGTESNVKYVLGIEYPILRPEPPAGMIAAIFIKKMETRDLNPGFSAYFAIELDTFLSLANPFISEKTIRPAGVCKTLVTTISTFEPTCF